MTEAGKAWTWRHAILRSKLPSTTRHVLLTISCYMNDVGNGCYPSTKQLAEVTGLSERSVCTHIAMAKDAGWLRVSQHGFAGRKWAHNEYMAAWPDNSRVGESQLEPASQGTEPPSVPQIQGTEPPSVPQIQGTEPVSAPQPRGTEPLSNEALKEVQSTSPVNNNNKNTPPEPTSASPRKVRALPRYSDLFEEFWNAYPRHKNMSKAEAGKEFEKLSEEDQRKCIAAVPGYLAHLKENTWLQAKHADGFIRRRRFDGFCDTPEQSAVPAVQWQKRMKWARENRKWHSEDWGPAPHLPGCAVPASLLEPSDGSGWSEWVRAA